MWQSIMMIALGAGKGGAGVYTGLGASIVMVLR